MPLRNPFKHHSKQVKTVNADRRQSQELPPYHATIVTNEQDVAAKRTRPLTGTDKKESQPSNEQGLPPTYSAQPQPPRYRNPMHDPFDPTGPAYGYQYEENEQNFPHPSSVFKDIGKKMTYEDPRAADLARRASRGGRGDLTEMLNYFLRQQELGKRSTDNSIAAWNGV